MKVKIKFSKGEKFVVNLESDANFGKLKEEIVNKEEKSVNK